MTVYITEDQDDFSKVTKRQKETTRGEFGSEQERSDNNYKRFL